MGRRRRASFGDLYANHAAEHPKQAGRSLADLRRRRAQLVAGDAPRTSTDTVEALDRMIAKYLAGFRTAHACMRGCGETLTDPVSVWRGYGRICWGRLSDEERNRDEAAALALLGTCPAKEPAVPVLALDPDGSF